MLTSSLRKKRKNLLNKVDPDARLDLKQIIYEWRCLVSESAKEKYRKLAQEDEENIGDRFRKTFKAKTLDESVDDKQKKKSGRNERYRMKVKLDKINALEENKVCEIKFQQILDKKTVQIKDLDEVNKSLGLKLSDVKLRNSVETNIIEETSCELDKLKEKYRALHKLHKCCKSQKH